MNTTHNHPPRCCCEDPELDLTDGGNGPCPLCPEHGELAQLANPQPGECPVCHSEIGKQHTDYCRFDGVVSAMPIKAADHPNDWTATLVRQRPASWTTPNCPMDCTHDHSDVIGQTSQPATHTSQPTTQARSTHIPIRSTDRWPEHPITQCSPELCGEPTPEQ